MVFGIPVLLPEKINVKACEKGRSHFNSIPHSLLRELLSGDMLLVQFQQALMDLGQGVSEQNKDCRASKDIFEYLEDTKGMNRFQESVKMLIILPAALFNSCRPRLISQSVSRK